MTVLVTGARGTIARGLIAQLRAAGVDVRAATRSSASAADDGNAVSFDPLDSTAWRRALNDVHAVFLYAAPDAVRTFLTQARAAGVEHIVLLSSTAASSSGDPPGPLAAPFVAAEDAIARTGVGWTFLRPAGFATNTRWWAPSIRRDGVARIPFPDAHTVLMHECDIVDVAVAAFTQPGHTGAVHTMTGPESLSQRRQVELIAEARGRLIDIEALDMATARAAFPFLPQELFDALASSDGPLPVGPTVEAVLGSAPRTFAQWARDHAADFS